MSVKLICSALFLLVIGFKCEDGIRHYDGYSVLRLVPRTQTQLNYLRELEENVIEVSDYSIHLLVLLLFFTKISQKLDFWRGPSYLNRPVDVMVPPHLNHTFDKIFNKRSFDKTVLINDLEKYLLQNNTFFIKLIISWNADNFWKKGLPSDLVYVQGTNLHELTALKLISSPIISIAIKDFRLFSTFCQLLNRNIRPLLPLSQLENHIMGMTWGSSKSESM